MYCTEFIIPVSPWVPVLYERDNIFQITWHSPWASPLSWTMTEPPQGSDLHLCLTLFGFMCLKRCHSNPTLETPDCFSLWALHLLNAGFSVEEAIILPNGGLDRRKQVTKAMCMRSAWLQWPGAADAPSESQASASSDTVQHQHLTVHYIFTIRMQKKSRLQMQTMQSLKKLSFAQALCKLNDLKLPLDQRHPQWLYPAVPSPLKPYNTI